MVTRVTLTVHGGRYDGADYSFFPPSHCVIGRAEDCAVSLHDGWGCQMVSRHHCQLDIDPGHVRVRDLGSRNGTYLNGRLIGQRAAREQPEDVPELAFSRYEVADGDELWIGPVVFRVGVAGVEAAVEEQDEEVADCERSPARA
jgi:pSer/pThr/pTyr-binding forkhead associated (FHA) protein